VLLGEDVSEDKASEMSQRCEECVDLNDAAKFTTAQSPSSLKKFRSVATYSANDDEVCRPWISAEA